VSAHLRQHPPSFVRFGLGGCFPGARSAIGRAPPDSRRKGCPIGAADSLTSTAIRSVGKTSGSGSQPHTRSRASVFRRRARSFAAPDISRAAFAAGVMGKVEGGGRSASVGFREGSAAIRRAWARCGFSGRWSGPGRVSSFKSARKPAPWSARDTSRDPATRETRQVAVSQDASDAVVRAGQVSSPRTAAQSLDPSVSPRSNRCRCWHPKHLPPGGHRARHEPTSGAVAPLQARRWLDLRLSKRILPRP
jgi:hypothetical protein